MVGPLIRAPKITQFRLALSIPTQLQGEAACNATEKSALPTIVDQIIIKLNSKEGIMFRDSKPRARRGRLRDKMRKQTEKCGNSNLSRFPGTSSEIL
jgi:hypothetical protein